MFDHSFVNNQLPIVTRRFCCMAAVRMHSSKRLIDSSQTHSAIRLSLSLSLSVAFSLSSAGVLFSRFIAQFSIKKKFDD
jgi:hypothetical protein